MRRRRLATLTAAAFLVLPAAAGAAEEGLNIFPDIDVSDPASWPSSPFVQLLVFFLVLIVPTQKLVFAPLLRVLDERRERIDGARARADTLRHQADEVLGRYESAVAHARTEAEAGRRGVLDEARRGQTRVTAEARKSAEGEVARAREEVAQALERAREELRREVEPLAREVGSRALGRSLA